MKKTFCALFFCLIATSASATQQECVILLHGLMRGAGAMSKLEAAATQAGFLAVNIDYDSLSAPIETLAPAAISQGLDRCREQQTVKIHFITHSLGGILLRYYLTQQHIEELGYSVLIAPPNRGSQVVDHLREMPGATIFLGAAGLQLGTDSGSLPVQLGPINFPAGIIAGDRTINPLLSLMLPNPDDGKVSVASTRLDGMRDFIVLHHSHVFIMSADDTIEQSLHFLRKGAFIRPAATD